MANRFASIAEIVGDRVAATLHEEFRDVDEGEKNAAILAVEEALRRADLTNRNSASQAPSSPARGRVPERDPHADRAVLTRIDEVIPELLPPRDMIQAEAISHAGGERLIPFLAPESKRCPPEDLPFVIRAAALTGSGEALSLLRELAAAMRENKVSQGSQLDLVLPEFIRAWSYFDPERYARKVISALGLRDVEVTDIRCLKGLIEAPTVKHVTVNSLQDEILDLSALDGLNISTATISNCNFRFIVGNLTNRLRSPRLNLPHVPTWSMSMW